MRRSVLTGVVAALALVAPAAAQAAAPGTTQTRTYPGGYRAIQYTPAALDRSRPAPLFVMVHGCGTTAEQQEAANELDQQAERDGFVVLYPDHDHATALHAIGCWNWVTDTTRTSPDPAAIAAMVRDAMGRGTPAIDPARVYLAGMSSGAMISAVLGATYPDLFAAIHMNAGCAYRAGVCTGAGPTRDTADLAREAYAAMGERKRVVPMLVTQGDKDGTVPPSHAAQVRDQWRETNDLVLSGRLDGPLTATPTRTREETPAGRYPSSVEQYDDPAGCTLVERWTIHGMDHFWPGGSADPASAPFTDPKGPDGGDLAWAFFRRYRKPSAPGGSPCVAAPAPKPRCRSRRRFRVTVPGGLRGVRVTLNGRRLAVRGRAVVVDLTGRPRGRARLVITGRTATGRRVRVVRTYTTCAKALAAAPRAAAAAAPPVRCQSRHWVGVWAAVPTDAGQDAGSLTANADNGLNPRPKLDDTSVRAVFTPTYGGSDIRVHLSNRFGAAPLRIDAATIARQAGGPSLVPGTLAPLTFRGRRDVTIPRARTSSATRRS